MLFPMPRLPIPSLSCLVLGLLFCLPPVGWAQGEEGGSTENSATLTGDERQRIEGLVSTLEDPHERKELVENLETLLEHQAPEEPSPWQVTQYLNIEEKSEELARQYFSSLEEMGLSPDDSGKLLIFVAVALVVAFAAWANRWLAGWLDHRLEPLRRRWRLSPERFSLYFRIQAWFGYLLGGLMLLYLVSRLLEGRPQWMDDHFTPTGIAALVFGLLLVALLFATVWEWVNFAMEYGAGKNRRLSRARLETLLPVVRNALLVVLFLIAMLMVLSEMGVDIMPLMAGAGVLGIAIGFGAQTLVKELINGFIVIFEDLASVGDVVRVGDRVGMVERITIRKMQLRDLDGTVSTVPFSEINIVDNLTKDYSYYLMDIGVAYRENVDEVMACLRDVDKDLRESEDYGESILAELEILGVNEFADSAVLIRARIKTRAHDKWFVGREFNKRMKAAFDARGIEIPFPHQTLYFGEDKQGSAPPGRIRLVEEEEDSGDQREAPQVEPQESGQSSSEHRPPSESPPEQRPPGESSSSPDGGDR